MLSHRAKLWRPKWKNERIKLRRTTTLGCRFSTTAMTWCLATSTPTTITTIITTATTATTTAYTLATDASTSSTATTAMTWCLATPNIR